MTLTLRIHLPQHGKPLGPDEIWVCIGGPDHKVYRGAKLIGWLIDKTDYPPPPAAPASPHGGYIMAAVAGMGPLTYAVERPDGRDVPGLWHSQREALEALTGEPVEWRG